MTPEQEFQHLCSSIAGEVQRTGKPHWMMTRFGLILGKIAPNDAPILLTLKPSETEVLRATLNDWRKENPKP